MFARSVAQEKYNTTYWLCTTGPRKDAKQVGNLHLQKHKTVHSLVADLKSNQPKQWSVSLSLNPTVPVLISTMHDSAPEQEQQQTSSAFHSCNTLDKPIKRHIYYPHIIITSVLDNKKQIAVSSLSDKVKYQWEYWNRMSSVVTKF